MMSGSGSGSSTHSDSNIIDLAGIISSFLLKLTTSMDDLLWLSPFLTLSSSLQLSSGGVDADGLFSSSWYSKMKHSIIYFGICVCVTMVSFLFGKSLLLFLTRFNDDNEGSKISYWNVERFLPICSSIVLLCIARRDYVEWKEEQEQGQEQVVSNNNSNDNYKRSRSSLEMLIVKDDDDNNNTNNSQIYDDVEEGNLINTNSTVVDNNVNTRIKEDGTIEMQNFSSTTSCSLSSRQQLRSRSSIHSTTSTSSSTTISSSIKIGKEKKNDRSNYIDANDDIDENKNNNNNDGEDSDNELRAKVLDASKSLHRFVIVCIMGTLDDMIVFSTFVAGSTSTSSSSSSTAISNSGHANNNTNQKDNNDNQEQQFLSLLVGTILAAIFIIVLSWGFSEMTWFQKLIQKIPMWLLMTGISMYILIMGLL